MKSRIIATKDAQFDEAVYAGANESGIIPVGDLVLVMTDRAIEKSKGGIIMTETSKTTMDMHCQTGILVALGPDAFCWNADRSRPWVGLKPEVGGRVMFVRYAGEFQEGNDGKLYRVMTDNNICAILEEASNE